MAIRIRFKTQELKKVQNLANKLLNVPTSIYRRSTSKGAVFLNKRLRRAAPRRHRFGRKTGGIGAKYPLRRSIRVRAVRKAEFRSRTSFSRASSYGPQGLWLDSGTHIRIRRKMTIYRNGEKREIRGIFPTGIVYPNRWASKVADRNRRQVTDVVVEDFGRRLVQFLR